MDQSYYIEVQEKMLKVIELMHVYLSHAPKHEKYALCQRIQNKEYEIVEILTEVRKAFHKKTPVFKLDVAHEQLRALIYIYYRLGYFNYHREQESQDDDRALRRFTTVSCRLNEIGAMIGSMVKIEIEKLKNPKSAKLVE